MVVSDVSRAGCGTRGDEAAMESERKHEVLSTGLLVAVGVALGVCLGQAGTARAILAHTHGQLYPIATRTSAKAGHTPERTTRPSPPRGPMYLLPGANARPHAPAQVRLKTSHRPRPHSPGRTARPSSHASPSTSGLPIAPRTVSTRPLTMAAAPVRTRA
jgi:hypothetical protein